MNYSEDNTFEANTLPLSQPIEKSCGEDETCAAGAAVEAAEPMISSQYLETLDETLNEEIEANSSEDEEYNDCSLTFSPTKIEDNLENDLVSLACPMPKRALL